LASHSHATIANTGFGREVTEAMERRRQSLVNMWAMPSGWRTPHPCLQRFHCQLGAVGGDSCRQAIAAERGLTFTPAKTGAYVSGTATDKRCLSMPPN
jgi:hypothetical protein